MNENNNRKRRTVFRSGDFAARLFYVLPTRRQLSAAEKGGFERPKGFAYNSMRQTVNLLPAGVFYKAAEKSPPA